MAVVGVGSYFFLSKKAEIPLATPAPQATIKKEVDIKAGFEIYTKGTKRVFTDPRYHNLSPDVFIEGANPNTANVKKEGITWADFFKTLPMQLTKDCLITGTKQTFCTGEEGVLRFYINGAEDKDALDRQIQERDSLLVRYE